MYTSKTYSHKVSASQEEMQGKALYPVVFLILRLVAIKIIVMSESDCNFHLQLGFPISTGILLLGVSS